MHNRFSRTATGILAGLLLIASLVAPSAHGQDLVVRAMSYNIRYDTPNDGEHAWPNRLERVASIIRFHEPDIVGLQEALLRQLGDLAAELPAYSWIGVGRDDGASGGEFSAILYRNDRFRERESGTFWLSEAPDSPGSMGWDAAFPRIVTWAKLEDVATGQTFLHANTHMDHVGEEARANGAALIVARVDSFSDGLPVILTGDVNATPSSIPYERLASAYSDARALSETRPHGPEGTFSGFVASSDPMPRIDYVFVSPGLRVLRFATLSEHWGGSHGSDHLPVMADVVLPTD